MKRKEGIKDDQKTKTNKKQEVWSLVLKVEWVFVSQNLNWELDPQERTPTAEGSEPHSTFRKFINHK